MILKERGREKVPDLDSGGEEAFEERGGPTKDQVQIKRVVKVDRKGRTGLRNTVGDGKSRNCGLSQREV